MFKLKADEIDWRKPLTHDDILARLNTFSANTIDYRRDFILGFPTATPHDINVEVAQRFLLQHPNAIGLHTKRHEKQESEVGFTGAQQAEREVVYMVADVLGAQQNEVDGYLCTGATEGNIVGLWIARNRFGIDHTAVVASPLSHYSLTKALGLLNFPSASLRLTNFDENGHLAINTLRETLDECVNDGVENIVLFLNAGTTMLGSVDDVASINKIAAVYAREHGVNVHIHVDAAFGGMVAPFLDHLPHIGFKNNLVMSIAVDLHKAGKTPFGGGVILARKNLFANIETHAPYFPGNDHTLSGSRPGLIALQCWATMRAIGKDGYASRAHKLHTTTGAIRNFLEAHGFRCFVNDINVVAVIGEPPRSIQQKYIMHVQSNFPQSSQNAPSVATTVWNIVVMDHTANFLNEFFSDIKQVTQ